MTLDRDVFAEQFARFQRLIAYNDGGRPFVDFHEGVAGVWESYKPRLRDLALGHLGAPSWTRESIGSGDILEDAIAAIEINDSRHNLQNNLVFWQNRYGHANRAHRAMLEARNDIRLRGPIETALFALYRSQDDEGATFERLSELTYGKYPLLAYLYFLKDMDRFMPILPTTFDRVFRSLGIELVTSGHCSWDNYLRYNEAIGEVRKALKDIAGLDDVRLIDAHSFCWLLDRLDEPDPDSDGRPKRHGQDPGRKLGGREVSILEMMRSVLDTVRYAQGQTVERVVKPKELHMSEAELKELIEALMKQQEDRCALTGLPLQFRAGSMMPTCCRH